jgi:energy-coupling factor transporter ATP-binding protein EcfA2
VVNDAVNAVFGHRNARSKTPAEVARGFVAPPQYWEIAQPGNTVLVGPRGSGKTTLLKMLQGPGLEHWESPESERARELVTYSGVFVSADKSWSGQVTAYGAELDDRLRTSLGDACYTLHALRALARTAASRVKPTEAARSHDRAVIDRATQERIVAETWKIWGLSEPVGSFAGLAEALSSMISKIGILARRAVRLDDALEELRLHPALDLELVDAVVPFIERFNGAAGEEDHVWAFLIDEIEFLPPGIHGTIIGSMRGRDSRLIRKISLAPYNRVAADLFGNPLGGWEGHDLERVNLTFPEKEDGYPFSRALIEKELEGLSLELTPAELLGEGGFFENDPGRDAYVPGSGNADAISSLADKDPSFSAWLESHQIDPKRPDLTSGDQRAATLRKAISIIALRDEYLHRVGDRLQARSRKAARTYVGELSTFAICENNPRLLQTFVSRLLRSGRAPTPGERVEVIDGIAEQFSLHLRAIEVPNSAPADRLPRPLVEKIGRYLEAGVLGPVFSPEPPLSFKFVPTADKEDAILVQVISQLVFYGAVIPYDDEVRFRLAHTFAPLFKLPLRKGRSVSLRSMLGSPDPDSPHPQMNIEQEAAE